MKHSLILRLFTASTAAVLNCGLLFNFKAQCLHLHPSYRPQVIHERGSPETLRDPRGFAVKFYTRCAAGNLGP